MTMKSYAVTVLVAIGVASGCTSKAASKPSMSTPNLAAPLTATSIPIPTTVVIPTTLGPLDLGPEFNQIVGPMSDAHHKMMQDAAANVSTVTLMVDVELYRREFHKAEPALLAMPVPESVRNDIKVLISAIEGQLAAFQAVGDGHPEMATADVGAKYAAALAIVHSDFGLVTRN